ncbi:MAG: hypothetical protein PVG70_15540 [Desulfobacterales bacterium]
MKQNSFRYFPPERMYANFPWTIWAVGWLALFKAFLWLAYEPVQTEAVLKLLGYKYTLNVVPLVIFGFGIWNLRRWAVWGIIAISIANLIFFVVYPQTIYAVVVESEVFIYSILLSLITLLCNGPLGDFLILCAVPSMLKHTPSK